MKHAINWFSIPVSDIKRAVKFYNTIFDFTMNETQMNGQDPAFFPIEQGGIGGHLATYENYKPSGDGVIIYLNGGDNLQTILDRVEDAGGKIAGKKVQVTPEIGYVATFFDTEGNRIALHSPN